MAGAQGGSIMLMRWIEYLALLVTQATPVKAMLTGAVLGMFPALVVVVRGQLAPDHDTEPATTCETSLDSKERQVTCAICNQKVKMSDFATHVTRHRAVWLFTSRRRQGLAPVPQSDHAGQV
jgi:hypothetical protein